MSNRVVGTSVWMLLHPWAYGQLRWTSLTLDEAIDVLTDLVLHVLPTREEVSPG